MRPKEENRWLVSQSVSHDERRKREDVKEERQSKKLSVTDHAEMRDVKPVFFSFLISAFRFLFC